MALLLFSAFVAGSFFQPGEILFLFVFSSGIVTVAALYLVSYQSPEAWRFIRAPLLVGTAIGIILVLFHASIRVAAIALAGIALFSSLPLLLGLTAECLVITVDVVFFFEIFRRGR